MLAHQIDQDLSLELLEPLHAQELFAITDANRAHLRTWLPWVDRTKTVDDTRVFIGITQQQLANNNGFHTAIRHRQLLVGVVGYHKIDWSNRFASIGYWLAEDAQGQGIMTKSVRAHIDHLFGELDLHRIEIRCAVENSRSRAVPRRLGFREEGIVRGAEWLYDHFVDHVVYGLLAPEWTQPANHKDRSRFGFARGPSHMSTL